jgi:hypothetical protein
VALSGTILSVLGWTLDNCAIDLSFVIGDWSFDDLKLAGFKENDKSPMTNLIAH